MPLRLDLSAGDVIRIGTGTVLRVEHKTGGRTRVSIDSEYRVVHEPKRTEGSAAQRPNTPGSGITRPK